MPRRYQVKCVPGIGAASAAGKFSNTLARGENKKYWASVTGLTPGKAYRCYTRAFNSQGEVWSAGIKAVTAPRWGRLCLSAGTP